MISNGFLPTFEEGTTPFELPANPAITRERFHQTITNMPAQQEPLVHEDLDPTTLSAEVNYFGVWIDYSRHDERFRPEVIIEAQTYFDLSPEEEAAYAAPFPSRVTMGGVRAFPGLVNQLPSVTDAAWAGLGTFENPFLTIWGDNDSGNLGHPLVQQRLINHIPGSEGWEHVRLPEASHFLQDDQGEEIARRVNEFVAQTPKQDEERSLLEYHDGYWVTEMENPDLPVPLTIINDMHIDAATNRVTVYAQARLANQIAAPPQVGPGECAETPMGEIVCFHPDAVYLNGSGGELMEADGTGSWWVKHAWTLGGEGYLNCELHSQQEYNDCIYVEGVLLDDGLSMRVGPVEEGLEGFFNVRTPLLAEHPIAYQVTRYEPTASEMDQTPTAQWVLIWQCQEVPSALDNQVRPCPAIQN
ncbi:hypothetical protein HC928_04675 [bacterium]|nr:hypothetical protein [bacterium]